MPKNSVIGFRATKVYDVLIATPLVIFYGFSMAGLQPLFAAALRTRSGWLSALKLADLSSDLLYFALVIALVFLRKKPVRRPRGVWPRAVALLGSMILLVLPLAQRLGLLAPVWLSPELTALSTLLTGGGTIAELVILSWLGRSFSLVPEARGLVTKGPYRRIRHPLYLCSIIASLGVMLQFAQPWALLVVLTAFVLQVARMNYEEELLARTFPDYVTYMARTWRLIPRLY